MQEYFLEISEVSILAYPVCFKGKTDIMSPRGFC